MQVLAAPGVLTLAEIIYKILTDFCELNCSVVECSPGMSSSTRYQPCLAGSYQPNSRGTAYLQCSSSSPGAFCPVASEEV